MTPDVPFVALDRTHAPLHADLTAAFERVVASSAFVLGREVEAFEAAFAAACGVEHCAGVASGTAALTLALQALGVGPGDEVVVPAHTFIASALAVLHAGATPVLADVDAQTGLLDPASANACLGPATRAILAVHLYGQCCDMDALGALARDRGVALVEDAAQAHGATWDGRPAGSLGDVAAFSFYPSKNLGALGDGGAVTTGDAALADRVRALRHLGQRRKGEHELAGWNERLDGLQAALLAVKLPHLAAQNEARRRHAARLRAALAHAPVELLGEHPRATCVYHLFPVRTPRRDRLAGALSQAGVATGIHYSPALHGHEALRGRVRTPVPLPHSERWAAQELSLPMFAELTDAEVDRVAAAVAA